MTVRSLQPLVENNGMAYAEWERLMKKPIHHLLVLSLASVLLGLASCQTASKPAPAQAAAETQDHSNPKAKPGTP